MNLLAFLLSLTLQATNLLLDVRVSVPAKNPFSLCLVTWVSSCLQERELSRLLVDSP